MMLASTRVHVVERALKNGCGQCLCPQHELHFTPASPGDSPRSAGRSDPGSFQITTSALGPGACDIFWVSISHSSPELLKVSPTGLQTQMFWGVIIWCWGAQCGVQTAHSLGRTSAIIISLLFVGCPEIWDLSIL